MRSDLRSWVSAQGSRESLVLVADGNNRELIAHARALVSRATYVIGLWACWMRHGWLRMHAAAASF